MLFCYSILNYLQGLSYLDLLEGFDEVAFYNVVVALDTQTALHVETSLLDIVFTMLERREFASVDHDTVTDYAAFVSTFGFTSRTIQPAIVPTLEIRKVCNTSRVAVTSSLISGESIPAIADLISLMVS